MKPSLRIKSFFYVWLQRQENSTNYEFKSKKTANNRTKLREDCGFGSVAMKFGLIRPCAFLSKKFFLKRSMPMTQAARAAKNARYRQKMTVMHNMIPGFFLNPRKKRIKPM